MKMPKSALAALLVSLSTASTPNLSEVFFSDAKTVILFLGDSITADGRYLKDLQAALLKKYPGMKARFVNAGVSGESMPGLMKRVDSVLQANKPSLVFSSYGMNDGGYNPLDAAKLKSYHDAVAALLAAVTKSGAPLILMTPTAFDSLTAVPLIVPAPPYYFKRFYRNYDSVLTAYGNSVATFRAADQVVLDIQNPLRIWAQAKRRANPTFAWTAEGVHPTSEGHQVMADAIFAALFPPVTATASRPAGQPRHAASERPFSASPTPNLRGFSANGARSE